MSSAKRPKFLKPNDDSIASERDSQPSDDLGTAFVFNPNRNLSIEAQRGRLPIRKFRDTILFCLEKYQVLVLVGETGCGKSTQVPQYLYEFGWHVKGLIGVTQPRRISATTLAERVAYERGELLGDTVGVTIRFLDKTSERTHIKYMTEGILIREMQNDPLLLKYGVIMIDEAHERTILTDTVLALLKTIIKKRERLRLIISSATIDAAFFRDYFNVKKREEDKDTSIALTVEGRMYNVQKFHINEPTPNYVKETVNTVMKIHRGQPPGDILAFLTGQEEIQEAVRLLTEHYEATDKEDMQILPFYGSLPNHEQVKVFFATPRNVRKVVIATNIAEASVTIPNIAYVIDCGFVKIQWYKCDTNTNHLIVVPISKAAARQRAGRAGRVRPGKAFRLYPETEYQKLDDKPLPEIRRADLCSTVLLLKVLNVKDILNFDFPDPPPTNNLQAALETLYALGAIDDAAEVTRPLGYTMAEMPMNVMTARMLYASGEMGCAEEILSIVALLQVQNIFSKPTTGQGKINARTVKRANFEAAEGDLITAINAYNAFVSNGCTKEFCGQNYLIYKNLMRAHELREKLVKLAQTTYGIPIFSCKGDVKLLCRCITAGFFPNAAFYHYTGVYRTIRGNKEVYVHPLSTLEPLSPAKFVIFCEVQDTTKLYMKDLTVIEEEWLLELAPHYYHKGIVKERN